MTIPPSPFSPSLPSFQVAYDSTALGWLKTCPRLYQYQMLEQWTPRSRGLHLAFGGWYASGVEIYAHMRARGESHDQATLTMVRRVLEMSGDRDEDGVFTTWESGDNVKSRYTLIRSLVWNVEDRKDSPFKTVILSNGRPAVELSFNFEAFEIDGEPITLSGHMDGLVEADGATYVIDDKTTGGALGPQYFQQWTPNNQMSLYTIAGQVILAKPIRGVLVRAAQIGVNFTRFATQQIPRPKAVLDEWMVDTEYWIRQAKGFALANYWPLNDKSCFLCSFKRICAVSPSHRHAHLDVDFEKREWNPLLVRGDV